VKAPDCLSIFGDRLSAVKIVGSRIVGEPSLPKPDVSAAGGGLADFGADDGCAALSVGVDAVCALLSLAAALSGTVTDPPLAGVLGATESVPGIEKDGELSAGGEASGGGVLDAVSTVTGVPDPDSCAKTELTGVNTNETDRPAAKSFLRRRSRTFQIVLPRPIL